MMVRILKLTAVSTLAILAAQTAVARDLVIAGWGGVYQDVQREAYFQPFADEKGIKFTETTYLGGLAEVKAMADTGDTTWDLVIVEGSDLVVGCDEGLFETLDWATIAHQDRLIPAAHQDCGVGNVVIPVGLGYNSEATPKAPESLSEFFNLADYPGKRGMRSGPKFNLEFALLGDGVAPEEVYAVLATPEGLDRAFAKLDTIKPELQFWDSGSQPVEWLAAGNVTMSMTYNGRISAAQEEGKPLGFLWDKTVYSIDSWAVPAGSPNKALAMEFLSYVNDPARQAAFSNKMAYGPTSLDAPAQLAEGRIDILPAGPNMDGALYQSDEFWIDHNDAITERWNNWVTR